MSQKYPIIEEFPIYLSEELLMLRDKRTPNGYIKDALWRIGAKLAWKAKEKGLLPMKKERIVTGMGYPYEGEIVDAGKIMVGKIYRAAEYMVGGVCDALRYRGREPTQISAWLARDEKTAKPHVRHSQVVRVDGTTVIWPDPMFATGRSLKKADQVSTKGKPEVIVILTALASQGAVEGEIIKYLRSRAKKSYIYAGAIDRHWEPGFMAPGLNEAYFIVKGAGDIGDRANDYTEDEL